MFRKFPRKLLSYLLVFVVLTPYLVGPAPLLVEAVNAEETGTILHDYPSINELNKTNNKPYVEFVSHTYDSITLNFVNNTNSQAFFEVRIDEIPVDNSRPLHPNPCKIGTDPLHSSCNNRAYLGENERIYPGGISVDNRASADPKESLVTKTFQVNNKVEIRLALGGERSWDFNWVTFNVNTPYPVPTYHSPANGALKTISAVKLVWYPVAGVSGGRYDVRYATSLDGLSGASILSTGQSVYKDLTLSDGTYFWQMRLKNSTGTKFSEWATPRSFTINTHPDPTNQNQLNLGGNVYRDFAMNDCFGLASCNNKGESLGAGWVFNLYEEKTSGNWTFLRTTTTASNGKFGFGALQEAGTYHFCAVVKDGWQQQVQNWSGTPYYLPTSNLSGNASEGEYCRTVVYDDKGDKSNVAYFGFVDVKAPTAEIIAPNQANQDILIKGVATDNHVIKSHWFEIKDPSGALFYKNFPSNSATEVTFNLTEATNGTGNLTISDGEYKIRYVVTDITGNRNDDPNYSNPTIHNLLIDTTAPTMSNIKMFVNGEESELTKSGDTIRITAEVTDEYSDLDKVQIWVREYPWDPNNNELISGQMSLVSGDLWEFIFVVPATYKDGDALNENFEGNYFNFRPYDVLGNSHIGWRENFTIDNTAPEVPTNLHRVLKADTSKTLACGEVSILQGLEPHWDAYPGSDFLRYNYQTRKGHNDTSTVNWYDIGNWVPTVEGMNGFRVQTVDLAGNVSDWSEWCDTTFDSTAPVLGISEVNVLSETEVEFTGFVFDENFSHYYCWLTKTSGGEIANTRDENCVTTWAKDLQKNGNPATSTNEGDGSVDDPVRIGGFDITGLEDGDYIVHLGGVDKAGNLTTTSMQFTIEEESTPTPTPTPTDDPTPTPTQVLPTVTNTPTDTAAPTPTSDILPQSGQSTSQTSSTGSVLSAANSNSSNNNNTSRLVRNFALTASTGNTDNSDENSDEDTESANILGEEVCKEDKKISGKVFLDKNKNGEFDEGDEALDDIDLRIYTHNADDERVLVKTVTTDSEGDWELDVCIGSYEVEISENSIPDGMKVEQTVQEVEIEEGDEEQGVVFAIFSENGESEQSFWEKYQWWIIGLVVLILLAGGGMYLTKRSENQN